MTWSTTHSPRDFFRPALALAFTSAIVACSSSTGAPVSTEPAAAATTVGATTAPPTTAAKHHSSNDCVPPTTTAPAVVAGPEGIGDPYYPSLGNSGYQVARYELDLAWEPADGTLDRRPQSIRATARHRAEQRSTSTSPAWR